MKRAWKIALAAVVIALVACVGLFFLLRETPTEPEIIMINGVEWVEPTIIRRIRRTDPFAPVIRAYAALLENRPRADALSRMDEDQRRQEFAQGFEMLAEDAFLSLWAYRFEESASYVLYDFDGTEALLITGPWGLTDIYIIQNGIAVQIKSFHYESEGDNSRLLPNGTIVSNYTGERSGWSFYRFENGTLQFQGGLTQSTHILADGTEIPITREEYWQIGEEYAGNWVSKSLAWRPIAEFGR